MEDLAHAWEGFLERDPADLVALRVSLAGRIPPRDISAMLQALAGDVVSSASPAAVLGVGQDAGAAASAAATGTWIVEAPMELGEVRHVVQALIDARRVEADSGRRSAGGVTLDLPAALTPRFNPSGPAAVGSGVGSGPAATPAPGGVTAVLPRCNLGVVGLELMSDCLHHWGYRGMVLPAAVALCGGYLSGGHIALVGPNANMLAQAGCLAAISARAQLVCVERPASPRANGGMPAAPANASSPRQLLLQQVTAVLQSILQLRGPGLLAQQPLAIAATGGFCSPSAPPAGAAAGREAPSAGSRRDGELHVVLLADDMLQVGVGWSDLRPVCLDGNQPYKHP